MKHSLKIGSLLLVALAVGCRQPRPPLKNGFLPPELEQQFRPLRRFRPSSVCLLATSSTAQWCPA